MTGLMTIFFETSLLLQTASLKPLQKVPIKFEDLLERDRLSRISEFRFISPGFLQMRRKDLVI